jgi:glycosyltransferase involved in cell wall biosynthesis
MSIMIECKLALQQRVLPVYRAAFFDLLAESCRDGLSVFAGTPRPGEALGAEGELKKAVYVYAENMHMGRGRIYACHQRNILTWLARWDPGVLVAEANPRYLSTPSAVRWMKERGRPVIGWGLGVPPGSGFWRNLLRDRFLAGFDALITYSSQGAEEYRSAGFPTERIFIAPNASIMRPQTGCPDRPTGYKDGRARLLFVGRLQSRKRVDLLLRACAMLPAEIQPELTIVGEGPVRPDLEALAQEIYPRAEFTGEKHGEDVRPYFHTADLFVLPGTGGLAVQHAMSEGLPVLVAEADGTQGDLVRSGNGWLVPAGDQKALAERISEAIMDPVRLRSMGRESFRIVFEEINLEVMVAVFTEAVRTVQAKG